MSKFLRLGRLKNFLSPTTTAVTPVLSTTPATKTQSTKANPHRRTDGPQLFILRLLSNNGPLTSKQIWTEFQRQTQLAKQSGSQFPQYFNSVSHLKFKILAPMRQREKVKSKGYNRIGKIHLGWQINVQRAFKNIHPEVKTQLNQKIKQFKHRQMLKKENQQKEAKHVISLQI